METSNRQINRNNKKNGTERMLGLINLRYKVPNVLMGKQTNMKIDSRNKNPLQSEIPQMILVTAQSCNWCEMCMHPLHDSSDRSKTITP